MQALRSQPSTVADHDPAPQLSPAPPWLLQGTPQQSRWRVLAAIGAIGEAVAHIPLMQEHLSEASYIGVGFVLLSVAGIVLGFLLLIADTPKVWTLTMAVSVLALVGYALSRTVGLPEIQDDIGNWAEPLGIVAIATETMMLLAAVAYRVGHDRT